MKTRIQKIIIMAVALLFASVAVSFADDLKGSRHKPPGNAYGHYKKGYDYHSDKYEKHFYGYRNPWYGSGHYRKGDHYRNDFYRYHHSQRYKRYPSHNTFFFGFLVR